MVKLTPSAFQKAAAILKTLPAAEIQAALQAAGLVPQRQASRKALELPKDAIQQGKAILAAYMKLAANGKAPRIGENSVRAYMLAVASTVGYVDDADGRLKVACCQLAEGKPVGGSISFAGFHSEDPFRRRHYMGKPAESWIARKQANGAYVLQPIGAPTKADPKGKATGSQAALGAPSTNSTASSVIHNCGARALLGSTCRQCKQTVTAADSKTKDGTPLVKPRKARKARSADARNGKATVVHAADSAPAVEPASAPADAS